MAKENEANEFQELYDDSLDGHYEVISAVVKIIKDFTKKKPAITDPVFFNGEKIYCEGYYVSFKNIRYLKIDDGARSGYVPETALMKL